MPKDHLFDVRVEAPQITDLQDRVIALENSLANSTAEGGSAEFAAQLVRLSENGTLDASLIPALDPKSNNPGGSYRVIDYGAIWDGDSHPLSQRFTSLEDAQAVYPHADSLEAEIDWAATQAAVNAIVLDWARDGKRYGGTVELPPGTGRLNRSVFYPESPVWVWQDYPTVNIKGQGRNATILEWRDNDCPIHDGYAIQPRTATVVDGQVTWSGFHSELHADCRLELFSMKGPGGWRGWGAPESAAEFVERYGFQAEDWKTAYNVENPRVGQIYEKFSGISAGERTCLNDIFITGFHVGVNWRGGQKSARLLFTEGCYYGVYLTFTEAAHGDFVMEKCNLSGRFAAIAIEPAGAWYGHMDTCFVGGSPYAVYMEGSAPQLNDSLASQAYGGHWKDFGSGLWSHCQFESVGNAIFAEGNVNRRHELRDLTLQNCIFREVARVDTSFPARESGYKGSIPCAALIDVRSWKRVSILRSHDPEHWLPRDRAIFRSVIAPEDVRIDSCDGFLDATANLKKQFFEIEQRGHVPGVAMHLEGDRWSGTLFRFGTNGDVDVESGDAIGVSGLFSSKFNASSGEFIGAAMEANYDRTRDQFLVVATHTNGYIPINVVPGENLETENDHWAPSQKYPGLVCRVPPDDAKGRTLGRRGVGQWWCRLKS